MPLDTENTPANQLHRAMRERDLEMARMLLDAGMDPNARRTAYDSCPPLVRAIERGFTEGALLLIDRGASVIPATPGHLVPLIGAAAKGDARVCRALIERGAPVDQTDSTGETPLFKAAAHLHTDLCQLLIEQGADVNAVTGSGSTPMRVTSVSAAEHATEVLRLLLAAGASAATLTRHKNTRFDMPLTAFQCAVAHGRDRNVLFFIDEAGEDPAQTTVDGKTMVELAPNAEMRALLTSAIIARSLIQGTESNSAPAPASCAALGNPSNRSTSKGLGPL
jgi:ankyrin repeat protein